MEYDLSIQLDLWRHSTGEQNIFEALDVLRMCAIISWIRFDSCWLAGVRDMGYHPAMEVSMIWPWVSETLLVPMTITGITMYESKTRRRKEGETSGLSANKRELLPTTAEGMPWAREIAK